MLKVFLHTQGHDNPTVTMMLVHLIRSMCIAFSAVTISFVYLFPYAPYTMVVREDLFPVYLSLFGLSKLQTHIKPLLWQDQP